MGVRPRFCSFDGIQKKRSQTPYDFAVGNTGHALTHSKNTGNQYGRQEYLKSKMWRALYHPSKLLRKTDCYTSFRGNTG